MNTAADNARDNQHAASPGQGDGRGVGKIVLIAAVMLVGLLAVLAGLISLALSTSTGTRWALNRVVAMVNDDVSTLRYESSGGTLLRGITLSGLVYSSNGNQIEIDSLRSSWNPLPLLYRQVSVNALAIDGLRVRWQAPEENTAGDTDPGNDPLAEIFPLPVSLQLDSVQLRRADIEYAGTHYSVDALDLSGSLVGTRLNLDAISISELAIAEGRIDIRGDLQIEMTRTLPLEGDIVWEYRGELYEDINSAAGHLLVSGDLNAVELNHTLSAPVQLVSSGQVYLGLAEPAANAEGTAMSMDLSHILQQQTLPLGSLEGWVFDSLTIRTSGLPDQLRIRSSVTVSSETLSPARLDLDAQLRSELLFIDSISIDSGSGGLAGNGLISWESGLTVDFDYTLEEQNPAVYYTDLPEGLQLGALASSGNIRLRTENDVLRGTFSIDTLEGQLNDYPLSGSGTLIIDGEIYEISGFAIESGDNSATLSGVYAEEINLQFRIDAPLIEQLYAEAAGSVVLEGEVTGTLNAPRIDLSGDARNVVFGDIGIARIELQGDYSNEANSLSLRIADTAISNDEDATNIQLITATLSGQPDDHRFALIVESDMGRVDLAAAGGLLDSVWTGTLQRGDLQTIAGNWLLDRQVNLQASAEKVEVQEHCWAQTGGPAGTLCLRGEWSPEQVNALITLSDYPLAALNSSAAIAAITVAQGNESALLPVNYPGLDLPARLPDNVAVTATLNADVQIAGAITENPADLLVRATLSTGEGTLFVVTEAVPDDEAGQIDAVAPPLNILSQFSWPSLTVRAERASNIWSATAALEFFQQNVEDTGIAMRGSIYTMARLDAQENLQAQLDLAFDDLRFIEAFVPQLQSTQGQLNSQIRVRGSLEEPQFSGDMLLEHAQTDIPALGLQLRNLQASLSSTDGESLTLTAQLESGDGVLNLESRLLNPLDESRELSLTLRGDNFQLAYLPELLMTVSPNLQATASASGVNFGGTLLIPQLNVEVTSLPESAVDVSADTVLVNQRTEGPQVRNAAQAERGILGELPIEGELRLILGEDVRFSGFGLTAQLDGALDINQRATGAPLTYGELSIVSGSYSTYGQTLTIEHGKLLFFGSYDNPGLDIRAVREAENVKVGVQMNGTLRNISSELFSTPTLPDGEIIAVLVTGKPFAEIGNQEGNALVGAITTLGINRGQSLTNQIRNQLGLDTFSIASSGDTSDSSLMLGKYLTPKIFIRYAVGLFDTQSVLAIDYSITDRIKLEATSGQYQSIDLTYTRER